MRETLAADVSGIADDNGLERVWFRYQWTRDDGNGETGIEGATDPSYTLAADDVDKSVRVRVSFVDRHGFSESLTSAAIDTVQPAENVPATGALTISGVAQVGKTLTADPSGISDEDGLDNAVFSYQWLSGDADIEGANGDTYVLTDAEEGLAISSRVSFTDDAGNQESLTAEPTAEVSAADVMVWESEFIPGRSAGEVPETLGHSVFEDIGGSLSAGYWKYDGGYCEVKFLAYTGGSIWLGVGKLLPNDFTLRVGDAIYTGSESKRPPGIGEPGVYWWPSESPDWVIGETLRVSVTVHPSTPLVDRELAPVIGHFGSFPLEHDGGEEFSFRIYFSEGVANTAADIRENVLQVTGGSVASVEAVGSNGRIWEVNVSPTASESVTVVIGAGLSCETSGAVCTADGRRLHNRMELSVSEATDTVQSAPAENVPATGALTISGVAQVGETLTADPSGISDEDGLDNAVFSYQWLSDATDIEGANGDTYVLTDAEEGTAISIRVSFTDDAGNDETLSSEATAAVAARPTEESLSLDDFDAGDGLEVLASALIR